MRDLPVVSPHGHVNPKQLLEDKPFPDPASLLVTPDHYVTRLLHASGVGLATLGVGRGRLSAADAREVWRRLCAHWHVVPRHSRPLLAETELAEIFEVFRSEAVIVLLLV